MGQSLTSKQSTKTNPRGGCPVKSTVVEVPIELEAAVKDLVTTYELARSKAQSGRRLDCRAMEADFRDVARECERAALEGFVNAAVVRAERIHVNGREMWAAVESEGEYMTAAGPIRVPRFLYREVRNGPTFDAVAARLGMVDGNWLPGAASQMAYLLQMGTSREAEETARQLGRLPYSRSSFERVGHVVGEHYVNCHADIDQELIESYEVPEEAAGVVASIDRVSVPMEEPRPKPAGRPRRGAPKKPIERAYRMAYCGTVALVDREGDVLHTIRYGRMPQGDCIDLIEGMASDVMTMMAQCPQLAVTSIADGAPEMWSLLDSQFNADSLGVPVHRLIDLYHLLEKLGAAATSLYGEAEGKAVTRRWHMRLRNGKNAALRILDELRATGNQQNAVREAITYIENNHDRMDYATARRENRPLGSGTVEATCKSLVALRMKRPGARWKERTGEHIIQLRALALSDRWDDAMTLTLRPLRRSVRSAA